MQLRRLQAALQTHLLAGNGAAQDAALIGAIVDAPPLPAAARLAIYANAYRVRLIDALDAAYPVLHKLLGDDTFLALGEAFIASQPSLHRSLRWYGRELTNYLRRCPPYQEQPILAEIALFEWTLSEVFDAADAQPLQRAALAAIDPTAWSGLELGFHPSLRRLDLEWNTTAVWQAMNRNDIPPQPAASEGAVPWVLWRRDLQNYFRSLPVDEAAALDIARRGGNFGRICESLADWLPEEQIPLRAAGLIAVWADSGMIAAIS